MKVFGVLVLLAGLSLTYSLAEPSKSLTEYGLSEESLSSCNLERTDPSCGPASTEQVIESPVAGYKQFVHERGSPWFIAPCQIVGRPLAIEDNPSDQDLEDLYVHIAKVADRALNHMYGFVGEFFLKTYGADNVSFHEFWKANCYDWLPNHILIPKNLGETLPQEYLDTVIKDLKGLTLNASLFMRLAGYGLSKIEEDQKKRLTPFGFLFSNTREFLQKLQCDMEAAVLIYEPNRPDLPLLYINYLEEKLVTDYEFEAVRDWIIIREYLNTLEWFIQCITHYARFLRASKGVIG